MQSNRHSPQSMTQAASREPFSEWGYIVGLYWRVDCLCNVIQIIPICVASFGMCPRKKGSAVCTPQNLPPERRACCQTAWPGFGRWTTMPPLWAGSNKGLFEHILAALVLTSTTLCTLTHTHLNPLSNTFSSNWHFQWPQCGVGTSYRYTDPIPMKLLHFISPTRMNMM